MSAEPKEDVAVPETDAAQSPAASVAPAAENGQASDPEDKPVKALGSAKSARNGSAQNSKRKASAKSAAPASSNAAYKVGDIVLTSLKGYPDWPSHLVEPSSAPPAVQRVRPKNGTYYCSQFFPTADFNWAKPRDLKHLTEDMIIKFLDDPTKRKNGELRDAYEIAQDPTEWLAELEENKREEEAARVEAEEDELDEDGEQETGGKRKKSADKKDTKSKRAKLEEQAKKKKSKATVNDSDDAPAAPASKKKAAPAATKSKSKKEKAATEPTPAAAEAVDGDAENGGDSLEKDPEAIRVKDWRHKLQRAFLSKSVPSEEQMPEYHALFTQIETYEHMTLEYLQHSKIGKVMKKIANLPQEIPLDSELKIKERATKLMNTWATQIQKPEAEAQKTEGGVQLNEVSNDVPKEANGTDKVADAGNVEASTPAATEDAAKMEVDEPVTEANGAAEDVVATDA